MATIMKIAPEIDKLFKTRDQAVKKQDRKLFLSTQIAEIEHGSSDGYMAIDNLKTEVLHVHTESEIEKVVFVKETYSPTGKDPHSSFSVYFLTNTTKGWKIYRMR